MKFINIKIICFSIILTLFAGCAGEPIAISTVAKDKRKYLTDYFSPNSLPEAVSKKLKKEEGLQVGKEVKVFMSSKLTSIDGTEINRDAEFLYIPLQNGLVQVLSEYSNNGLPIVFSFSLRYKGLLSLKWGDANPARSMTDAPMEIKEITNIGAIPVSAGQEFKATFRWATVLQIANYADGEDSCKLLKITPASEYHKKFSGDAALFECERSSQGVSTGRDKLVFINQLGYAIPIEYATPNLKDVRTFKDVTGI